MTPANDANPPADSAAERFKKPSPFVWLFLLAAVNLIGPLLPIPTRAMAIVGATTLTLVYVGVVIAFALGIAHKKLTIPQALTWFFACVFVWLAVEKGLWPLVRQTFRAILSSGGAPTTAQQMARIATETLQDLALVCAAIFAGTLLSRLIRYPNMIGPIGAAIALVDTWGVLFGGPVAQMLNNKATQPLAEKALAAGPNLGATRAAQTGFSVSMPSIGVGDFLFIALLLSVLVNLAMNWKTAARLMWFLVCFALLSFQFLPSLPHLPGLVFIGAGAVLPNWKFFQFTREERFALLYAGIFVLLLTVGFYFGFKAALPTK